MSASNSETATAAVPRSRRSLANLGAFIFGLPAGLAVLAFLLSLPEDSEVHRYVHHYVERVELILFFCALGALVGKVLAQWGERRAFRDALLPAWNGQPVALAEAGTLRAQLQKLGRGTQKTSLFRRVAAILDFVRSRGSANELDDQIRALSDNDTIALEGSYAFLRLIIWAIPILGFLGTVLGITGAISGIKPDDLELSKITGGLSQAFDTTALALALTMILMFVNSMVERFEQRTLESVDRYVDEHLAHRFERTAGGETGHVSPALRQNAELVLKTTEQLVERQAAVWAKSMEKTERFLAESGQRQQDRVSAALESALERTLAQHQQRLAELEKQSVQQSRTLVEGITALANVIRDTGRQQQEALARLTEKVGAQADTISRLQMGEAHLVRLQEKLQHNLSVLAGSGAFEQAVQSLTAAIHLLTARAGSTGSRLDSWSAKAA